MRSMAKLMSWVTGSGTLPRNRIPGPAWQDGIGIDVISFREAAFLIICRGGVPPAPTWHGCDELWAEVQIRWSSGSVCAVRDVDMLLLQVAWEMRWVRDDIPVFLATNCQCQAWIPLICMGWFMVNLPAQT